MADNLQRQRYEHKYIISEATALAIRDFVSSYLAIDEFGATQPMFSYPVHSLYLDSPQMATYNTTINGDKNRYKLRLRFYEDRPASPVYFEIKKRLDNTISKERAGVKREAVNLVLGGQLPEIDQLVSRDPKQLVAIQNFHRLQSSIGAVPTAHVAYLREAWTSRESNSIRVTLDRNVRCGPEPTARLKGDMEEPVLVFGDRIVLELKFTDRFPDWFKELVQVFGLMQCGAAKYVDGVQRLGLNKVKHSFVLSGKTERKPRKSA